MGAARDKAHRQQTIYVRSGALQSVFLQPSRPEASSVEGPYEDDAEMLFVRDAVYSEGQIPIAFDEETP